MERRATMDPRLQKNQMQLLLNRRHVISDNELYEMLRSRQVFQVQIELRKELERTMQALKNAEKTRLANVMTQKAMFLKRVEQRNRNRRHLTDVSSVTQNLESLDLQNDDTTKIRENDGARAHSGMTGHAQNEHNDSLISTDRPVSQSKDVQSEAENAGNANNEHEQFYILPSVNREWMDKVRELTPRRCPVSTKHFTKAVKTKTPPNDENEANLFPMETSFASVANTQTKHLKRDEEKFISGQKGKVEFTKQSLDLKHHVSFAPLVDVDETYQCKNQLDKYCDSRNVQSKGTTVSDVLDNEINQTRFSRLNERFEANKQSIQAKNTNRIPFLKFTESGVEDKTDQATQFLLTEPCCDRGEMLEQSGCVSSCQGDFNRTSDSSTTELKPRISSRRPYFRRVSSPYAPAFRSTVKTNRRSGRGVKKSNLQKLEVSFLKEKERTVDMLFIEDDAVGNDPQSLGISQFDIDALMAFRRRKRGYSKTLSIKDLPDNASKDDEHDTKENQIKIRTKSKRNKTISQDQRPKTFREKSHEWYMGFLQARRNRRKPRPDHKATGPQESSLNRYQALPKILLNQSDQYDGTRPRTGEGSAFPRPAKFLVTKESTEIKLKQLQEHSRSLQEKVNTFSSGWLIHGTGTGLVLTKDAENLVHTK